MKRIFFLLIIILIGATAHSQIRDRRLICDPNPIVVNIVDNPIVDSTYTIRVLSCVKSSPLGLKIEAGYSRFYYNSKTADWLGQHGGPGFGLTFAIENTNIGLKFKPWTLYPKKTLDFNGNVLPISAKLNPIKIDYFLSYNFHLKGNFTFEPVLGYTRSSFVIINEDQIGNSVSIPKTGGFLTGISVSKYLTIKYNEFLSFFGNVEYAFVDFAKVSPDLGFGYFDWTVGIAFKGYFNKIVIERIY